MRNKLKEFHNRTGPYALQDAGRAERFPTAAAEGARSSWENTRELINACNELGARYRSAGQYSESISAFEQAKALAEDDRGKHWSEYATTLNNMAGTYRLMREYEHAIALFLQALELYRENGNQESYAYASVLNNLSLTYREMKQFEKAIEYLEQALELIEKIPEHRQELAVGYNNLTTLCHAAGDRQRAMCCLNRSLQEYEKCPDEQRAHYAEVLNSLAAFLYTEGEYERALTLYRKSAKHTRRLCGETEEYAMIFQNMRWVYEKMGLRKEAAAALEKAERVYERLLGPDHERTLAAADDLRRLRNDIG